MICPKCRKDAGAKAAEILEAAIDDLLPGDSEERPAHCAACGSCLVVRVEAVIATDVRAVEECYEHRREREALEKKRASWEAWAASTYRREDRPR